MTQPDMTPPLKDVLEARKSLKAEIFEEMKVKAADLIKEKAFELFDAGKLPDKHGRSCLLNRLLSLHSTKNGNVSERRKIMRLLEQFLKM